MSVRNIRYTLSLLLMHNLVVEAVGMWESPGDFRRVWEDWEVGFMASMLSILCHFYGLLGGGGIRI